MPLTVRAMAIDQIVPDAEAVGILVVVGFELGERDRGARGDLAFEHLVNEQRAADVGAQLLFGAVHFGSGASVTFQCSECGLPIASPSAYVVASPTQFAPINDASNKTIANSTPIV